MRIAIEIGGETVHFGERRLIQMPVASLYSSSSPLSLPLHVVAGKQDGPRLFVSAAMHGDELNGVEIIRRLLDHTALKQMRGLLIAVPIVNVFGIIQHSRYLPDRRDLNRSFPGSHRGSLAARLAAIFLEQVVSKCEKGIDLHTGALHRTNLAQIRANLDDPETMSIAEAFGVPVLINANLRDGSLRQAAADLNIPVLVYEAGEALRFDEFSIRAGVGGVIRVMRSMGMLPRRSLARRSAPWVARSSQWIRSPASGIFASGQKLGSRIRKGDLLGTIADPSNFFAASPEPILAPFSGVLIGRTTVPLVNEGDAAFHVARFEEVRGVVSDVESFQQTLSDDFDQ